MTRARYFLFFIPLVLLVVITSEKDKFFSPQFALWSQMIVGIMAWTIIWFRLQYLGGRKELSLIPALPIIMAALNDLLFRLNQDNPPNMPSFDVIMFFLWIGSAIILAFTFVPDERTENSRRMDSLSIMSAVIMGYFCFSFALTHLFEILGKR